MPLGYTAFKIVFFTAPSRGSAAIRNQSSDGLGWLLMEEPGRAQLRRMSHTGPFPRGHRRAGLYYQAFQWLGGI